MDLIKEIINLAILEKYDMLDELATLIEFLKQGGLNNE